MLQEQNSPRWNNVDFEKQINKTSLPEHVKDRITKRWYSLSWDNEFHTLEKELIIEQIKQNYSDPILNGDGYGQKDIIRKLKDMGL